MHADFADLEIDQLILLTCPICEEVLSNDPVFNDSASSTCRHTFCGDCIRETLYCHECREVLDARDLQPNSMAVNLLNTLRTPCIFKANGCGWKGKVVDLAAHRKACAYAATTCPFGCGEQNLMPRSMRLHVASCSFRMLDECACKKPFRFNERDAHEASCLPFHQARLPKLRAEVAALRDALHREDVNSCSLRRERGARERRVLSATVSAHLLALALASLVGSLVRPDASLAVALYLLTEITAEQDASGLGFGRALLLAAICADAAWFLALGPLNLASVAQLLSPETAHGRASVGGAAECEPLPIAMCALGAAVVSLVLKCVVLVPLSKLRSAVQRAPAERARQEDELERRSGNAGGGSSLHLLFSHGAVESPLQLISRWWRWRRAQQRETDRRRQLAAGGSDVWLLFLGRSIFVLSLPTAICRPDASAALAFFLLAAMRESRLYFSRTLLLLSVITLALDIAWCQFVVVPSTAPLLQLPAKLWAGPNEVVTSLSLQVSTALVCTVLSLPVKIGAALTALHFSCLSSHVQEPAPFRFDDHGRDAGGAAPSRLLARGPGRGEMPLRDRLRRERREELQLHHARGIVTLCLFGLLASFACALLRGSGDFSLCTALLLVAYGCRRHSLVCASDPARCETLLQLVAQLLAMALVVDVARVCLFFSPQGGPPDFDAYATYSTRWMPPPSSSSTGWRALAPTDKVAIGSVLANCVILTLMLQRISRLLAMLPTADTALQLNSRRRGGSSTAQVFNAAAFATSCLLSVAEAQADQALLVLALFGTTFEAESGTREDLHVAGRIGSGSALAGRHKASTMGREPTHFELLEADQALLVSRADARVALISGVSLQSDELRQLRDALAEERRALAALPCLTPRVGRRGGGLLVALLLMLVTSASDVLTVLAQQNPEAAGNAGMLVVVKLLLKAAFALLSVRLLIRPSEEAQARFGAGPLSAASLSLLTLVCLGLLDRKLSGHYGDAAPDGPAFPIAHISCLAVIVHVMALGSGGGRFAALAGVSIVLTAGYGAQAFLL